MRRHREIPRRENRRASEPGRHPALAAEDFLEEVEGAWVVGLAEPEHSLLADRGVAVGLGDFNEFWDAFVLRELAQREDGFFLHFGVGIGVDRALDGADGFLASLLGEP